MKNSSQDASIASSSSSTADGAVNRESSMTKSGVTFGGGIASSQPPSTPRWEIDCSDFENLYEELRKSNDPVFSALACIPDTDVCWKGVPRERIFEQSTIPDSLQQEIQHLPAHVRDCLYFFEKDWNTVALSWPNSDWLVREKFDLFESSQTKDSLLYELEEDDWQTSKLPVDIQPLPLLCTDALDKRTNEYHQSTLDNRRIPIWSFVSRSYAHMSKRWLGYRGTGQVERYTLSSSSSSSRVGGDKVSSSAASSSTDRKQQSSTATTTKPPFRHLSAVPLLHVNVQEVQFKLLTGWHFDAQFCSLALYELPVGRGQTKRRVSEMFHFNTTPPEVLGKLTAREKPADDATNCRQALFELENPTADTYLVLRVYRSLVGDGDTGTGPYMKPNGLQGKSLNKFQSLVDTAAGRLGRYTQPLGIAAIPLLQNAAPLSNKPQQFVFDTIVRCKTDMSDAFLFEKFSDFRKQKPLQGRCVLEMRMVEDVLENSLSPSLVPRVPFKSDAKPEVRMIEQFPSDATKLFPSLSYTHLLYVYPEFVNMSRYSGKLSARNLSIEVKLMTSDADSSKSGEAVIFGTSSMPSFNESAVTSVTWHCSKAHWFEEIKLFLPAVIHPQHHLLFVFKHVQCRPPSRKERNKPPEGVVGYAWLPLADLGSQHQQGGSLGASTPRASSSSADKTLNNSGERFLPNQEHQIPVAYAAPPNYLSAQTQESLRWVDKRRPVFTVRTQLVSTIHTQDEHLNFFFVQYNQKDSPNNELRKAIEGLDQASPTSLIRFLPIVLDQLLQLISTSSKFIAVAAFLSILHLLERLSVSTTYQPKVDRPPPSKKSSKESAPSESTNKPKTEVRHPLFMSFVKYSFENFPLDDCLFHERLINIWLEVVSSRTTSEPSRLSLARFSWFFGELLAKSLTQYLHDNKKLVQSKGRPADIVSPTFYELFSELSTSMCEQAQKLVCDAANAETGRLLNETMAYLFRDLISLVDRGRMINMLAHYITTLDKNRVGSPLTIAKFHLLDIITDHHWFAALGLPSSKVPTLTKKLTLLQQFGRQHAMISMLLREVVETVSATSKISAPNPARSSALQLVIKLIFTHSYDKRIQNADNAKQLLSSVATMYFPYVLLLIDNEGSPTGRIVSLALNWHEEQEREDLLFPLIWVLTHCDRTFFRNWWKRETQTRIINFFTVLANALEAFEYEGSIESGVEKSAVNLSLTRSSTQDQITKMAGSFDPMSLALARQSNKNAVGTISRGWLKRRQTHRATLRMSANSSTSASPSTPVRSKTLSPKQMKAQWRGREVALLLSQVLSWFIEDFEKTLQSEDNPLLRKVVVTSFLLLLKKNHSEDVLSAVHATIHSFLHRFKTPIFQHRHTPYCGDLTYELLRHCNFRSKQTRQEASALLASFFKINFAMNGNIARMKLATSVAVAKLVLQGVESDTRFLRAAMSAVAKHIADSRCSDVLKKEVDTLLNHRLVSTLKNHELLKEHEHDEELVHDLIYQISLGFVDSPDIRYTWLEGLSQRLSAQSHFEEAAQCKIHVAALISAYLSLLKADEAVSINYDCLFRAAPNSRMELKTSETATHEEGICASNAFTRDGLFKELEGAVGMLKQHQLFETAIEIQRLLSIIHKEKRHYTQLAATLADLASLCDKIIDSNRTNARLFSNYYLVGFYGHKFGSMHGKEFIYKEQGAVRLGDIMNRLPKQYQKKWPNVPVKAVGFSSKFDVNALDLENTLTIQIASVDPYLTDEELKSRPTPFECVSNIQRFIIQSPLIKPGGKPDNPEDAGKLKTFLTTQHPFPFVVKRIVVTKKETQTLEPIEAAIELLADRTSKLTAEVNAKPPNSKTLQIVLQGSVSTTVNAGPLAIMKAFLANHKQYAVEHIHTLRHGVTAFLNAARLAVLKNEEIIDSDQKAFHDMLVEGYQRTRAEAEKFLVQSMPDNASSSTK